MGSECKKKTNEDDEALMWYTLCLLEAKWRTWRREQYLEWLARVAKGDITQEFMDAWVIQVDEYHKSGQFMISGTKKLINPAGNGEGSNFIQPTAGSSLADGSGPSLSDSAIIASGLAPHGEAAISNAAGPSSIGLTTSSDTVVSTAKSKKSKKKKKKKTGKNKRANVAEERERDNGDGGALDTVSEKVSEPTHGSQLSSHMQESQSGQSMGSTATIEISLQDLKLVFGILDATDEEVAIVLKQRIQFARQQAHLLGQLNSHASHDNANNQKSTEFAKSTEEETRVATLLELSGKQKGKQKETQAQSQDVDSGLGGQTWSTGGSAISRGKHSNVALPRKGEGSLFKTMAKARVESKLMEQGQLDDEARSREMSARALTLEGAGATAKKEKEVAGASALSARDAESHVRFPIQLVERDGKMTWPPRAENEGEAEFDRFLNYNDEDS